MSRPDYPERDHKAAYTRGNRGTENRIFFAVRHDGNSRNVGHCESPGDCRTNAPAAAAKQSECSDEPQDSVEEDPGSNRLLHRRPAFSPFRQAVVQTDTAGEE